MRRFDHASVGVANGTVSMSGTFEEGGVMWTGQGPRVERETVVFDEPFLESPAVHVSPGMWDISGDSNQRVDVQAAKITREGFVIEFRTWGDTRVARMRANWMAIGPVPYNDGWDPD